MPDTLICPHCGARDKIVASAVEWHYYKAIIGEHGELTFDTTNEDGTKFEVVKLDYYCDSCRRDVYAEDFIKEPS